ncbi:TrmH family RNA methyltransferase [Arcanobacterium wilhelmae]|uniref:TrmH family RNA methyltransferase n=1 Tax=Arcanobacterium wilhelmae TaxID=1803177 RepID=A0ABT9NEY1_9ACTO|nr:RNA methyltransferase [Arcanobacterium wilhelmae]MDP9801741.1 TrmH family RNA methyltransferase [Arcanobacterium wilhelmae]WFN91056.1 RNA methyltransferase [Arcanobacterium wilhelmae]
MRNTIDRMTGQLKKVAGLYSRNARRKWERAVVEGPQAVREVLSSAPELIRDVYATDEALASHPDVDSLLRAVDPFTHMLPRDLFEQLTTTAQGILAVIDIPDEVPFDSLMADSPNLIVCAVQLSDPGNLGTIVRSADAAGADAVILGQGSVEAMNPKVIRSTAGSLFHLPILEEEDVPSVVERVKAAGMQVLLADGGGDVDLVDLQHAAVMGALKGEAPEGIDLRRPTLWLVGNEAHGFTVAQRALADAVVSVPMWGGSESLNVAMATTLCLYASASAQRCAN